MISENMIKGLFCIASQDCEGDCYKDHENFKHEYDDNWKPMVCGNCERDFVTGKEAQCCPYHQVEYGTCFEDGELWWLKELAELLKENRMSIYRKPTNEEKVMVADGMTVGLPIGTKAWVKYNDTCYGRVLRIATVIEKEGFGNVFDNGYENPICDIEWYAIAEQLKENEND